jgi:predicted Zn-dependent peptidase
MVAGKAISFTLHFLEVFRTEIIDSFLFCHHRKPVDHFLQCMDEMTLDDITAFAKKMLSSPPTMASWGDGIYAL